MSQAWAGPWGGSAEHRPGSLPRGGGCERVRRGSETESVWPQACSLSGLPLRSWCVCCEPAGSSSDTSIWENGQVPELSSASTFTAAPISAYPGEAASQQVSTDVFRHVSSLWTPFTNTSNDVFSGFVP